MVTVVAALRGVRKMAYAWAVGAWASGALAPGSWGTESVVPIIVLTPTSLLFQATVDGSNPPSKTVVVSNGGGGTLAPTLGSIVYVNGSGWLSANLVGSTVTVLVNIAGLPLGTYIATIPVVDAAASNNPQSITVTLTVSDLPAVMYEQSASGFGSSAARRMM